MKGIITFHSLDLSGSVLSYAPGTFADLIRSLVDSAVPICDLDLLLDPSTPRGVAITFDDGMASVFTHALPILREFDVPAHLFLTTCMVGGSNQWRGQSRKVPEFEMLDWEQVEGCHVGGIHIDGHTATHPDLRQLSDTEIQAECDQADEAIKFHLGRRPAYFAYPYGYSDSRVRRLMGRRYRGCVTTKLRPLGDAEDPAALPRIDAYYLRAPWLYRRLDRISGRAYLAARSLLRSLRGTQ